MRITFVISSLSSGGAERVMSIMANYWSSTCHDVAIITFDTQKTDFYTISPKVTRVALGLMRQSGNFWESLRHTFWRLTILRREIINSKPDVVISFIDTMNILTLLATRGLGYPVIVSERTDPTKHSIGRFKALLRHIFYPMADAVVVQTHGVKLWAERFVKKRVCVIPNPVKPPSVTIDKFTVRASGSFKVVSIGRITYQKGFDILISAFAKCSDKHPNWSLIIIGEGEEKPNLVKMANELGISSKVNFLGRVKEPELILFYADMFVMASRLEGFPNVLLEAMACGLPVISTDCPSGPAEIIEHGLNGLLVPPDNVSAMAEAMDQLMSNEKERNRLSAKAVEVVNKFATEKVMNLWEAAIEGALLK
jgi:GalNAc-alpha-(1->4)-GalNAc-alpha-(1->3)-diNAcBac-PP-undecaprenol alpha-1,4-N-acetyl-D-galactosaminyltransferase